MLPLVVGAAALVLALGVDERRIRHLRSEGPPSLRDVFRDVAWKSPVSKSLWGEVEDTVSSLVLLLPALRPVLRQTTLVIDMTREGGWYRPSQRQIVLGLKGGRVGVVTHEAIHALDAALGRSRYQTEAMFEESWESWRPESELRQIATHARQILSAQIDAHADAVVARRLEALPEILRLRLLSGERVPLDHAVASLVEADGGGPDPREVVEAMRHARMPMGGLDMTTLGARYPGLADRLRLLGTLLPIGIPMSLLGRPPAEQDAFLDGVALKEAISGSRGYFRSLHEVLARLADQSVRRAAEVYHLEMAPRLEASELDAPESLLLDVEPRLWRVLSPSSLP